MKTLPASLWLDLLGKPFRKGARGPDAYDCVGLLLEVERRMGYPIPAWGSHARELVPAMACWEPVTDPQPGDGILIHSVDPEWHVAVVCGDNYMIHAHPDCGQVVRERYNSFPWQARIEGFYRWKAANTQANTQAKS
jgi:cell wall-associated NlpC family hydrolase